jgi:hypothetical protein
MLRSWRATPYEVSPALTAHSFNGAAFSIQGTGAEASVFRRLTWFYWEVAMADTLLREATTHARHVSRESLEYRLIFGVCFIVFLLAGFIERLLPPSWRTSTRDMRPPLTLLQQAWGAAGTCTAYAFKG